MSRDLHEGSDVTCDRGLRRRALRGQCDHDQFSSWQVVLLVKCNKPTFFLVIWPEFLRIETSVNRPVQLAWQAMHL